MDKATIWNHPSRDWCHICGVREDKTADVWYPHNAEHPGHGPDNYVRICAGCAQRILDAAKGPQ